VPDLEVAMRFIRERTRPAPIPLLPEIRLWQASELTPLWHAAAAELGAGGDLPYWASPWAGGQALARHVLDHPDLVRGRRVLDFATASGLVAIAALRAGAREVVAWDVDPLCRAAVLLNAELNGVAISFREGSPLGEPSPDAEVVLAGDVFYEKGLAERAACWFRALAARGLLVLAGDAWRAYAPASGFAEVASIEVPTAPEIESATSRWARVLRFATRALVCGHATLDAAGRGLVPGGSVLYAARALAALGADVRAFTAAGPELPADALAAPPGAPGGVEAQVEPARATTRFENAYDGEGRRTQRLLAAAPPLDAARLPAGWREADVLFLAPVAGEIDPGAFLRAVRARVVGLGVQGLVRAAGPGGAVSPRRWTPGAADLAGVTAAFVGEDEAQGQPDLAGLLAATVPIVVLTRGARGCEVVERGRTRRVGAHPARAVVDPTGAGDVFAAAFLLALARGADPVEAARLGAGAASIAVEGLGAETLHRLGEAPGRAARVPAPAPDG
jgi:predicted nicotinamide N-methyase/sugar/nucleoside kinase (ribokinase family)